MPNLLSSIEVTSILHHEGFVFISQKGSHAKFRRKGPIGVATVIVPMDKKEIPLGTLRSIIRQSELPRERFVI